MSLPTGTTVLHKHVEAHSFYSHYFLETQMCQTAKKLQELLSWVLLNTLISFKQPEQARFKKINDRDESPCSW